MLFLDKLLPGFHELFGFELGKGDKTRWAEEHDQDEKQRNYDPLVYFKWPQGLT